MIVRIFFRRPIEVHLLLAGFSLSLLGLLLVVFAGDGAPVEAQSSNCAGPAPCNVTVSAKSRSPAATTTYEVEFVTPTAIPSLTGAITMELHDEIRVPVRIIGSFVQLECTDADGHNCGRGTAFGVDSINATNYLEPTTVIVSPALRLGDDRNLTIPAGARVKVSFRSEVGMRNPSEGGAYSWRVGIGNGPMSNAYHPDQKVRQAYRAASDSAYDLGLLVNREIQLTLNEVTRGQQVSAIARGYKNGTTLRVWRDANINGEIDWNELELCTATVGSNDIGRCYFSIDVPPFEPAFGECVAAARNCNFINALDGRSGSSVVVENFYPPDEFPHPIYESSQALDLLGRINVEVLHGIGGNIDLELVDFPQGVITAITIGGVPADVENWVVGPSGRLFFSFSVPFRARSGRQHLELILTRSDNGQIYSRDVIINLVHPAAEVQVIPDTVLPNQRIAISGRWLSVQEESVINKIRVDGYELDSSRVNDGTGSFNVTADRNWSGSLDLPINGATTVSGTHKLWLQDSNGRTGSVDIFIPPRKLEITPVWGRVGSFVNVSGQGFPALNSRGSIVFVKIYYESAVGRTVTYAETDINGAFSKDIRVPLNTSVPSSNFIRVEFEDDNGALVTTSVRHEIPSAVIRLSRVSGMPGSAINLTGSGFRHYTPVSSVTFSGLDVIPAGTTLTDAQGHFSMTIRIPGANEGVQTVTATVAGVSASVPFRVDYNARVSADATPLDQGLANLGEALSKVFHFNNNSKEWAFYAPEVPEESGLTQLLDRETYLIQVKAPVVAILNGKPRQLTCREGNCWNQLVW